MTSLNSDNIKRKLVDVILKSLLLVSIFLVALFIDITIVSELIFIEDGLPDYTVFKVQNRILVILFLCVLLKKIGQNYVYLFIINPLKNKDSYVWIISMLFAIYLTMQTISGFDYIGEFRILPLTIREYIQLIIFTVILIPVEEEFLFRGLLLLVPSQKIKYVMLLVSSIIFASMHDDPARIFCLGLGLGILAIRFNNMWIPILAHALWNLVVLFFSF